jgi:hypothetical protein
VRRTGSEGGWETSDFVDCGFRFGFWTGEEVVETELMFLGTLSGEFGLVGDG